MLTNETHNSSIAAVAEVVAYAWNFTGVYTNPPCFPTINMYSPPPPLFFFLGSDNHDKQKTNSLWPAVLSASLFATMRMPTAGGSASTSRSTGPLCSRSTGILTTSSLPLDPLTSRLVCSLPVSILILQFCCCKYL